ncbi:hypothetical protein, partial [Sulfitobacter mediterraneus]|uniref:hypothetical protein n=1 Tax=Sulfitobacter mediterraneus TaxID=83219 RepID=UPI001EED957D
MLFQHLCANTLLSCSFPKGKRHYRKASHAAGFAGAKPPCLLSDLGHNARADRTATFADREAQTLL